jgi:hypothetical protein
VATLRRVWSRKDFEPAGNKWLHTTDFGRLEYDMWEHADNPPRGSDHGLRINKVHAVVRSEREKEALVRDRHAWVGLPIGYETVEEFRLREKEKEPENVTRLKSKSPYNAPVVNWGKFEAEYTEANRLKKEEEARMTKSPKKHGKGKGKHNKPASSGSERSDTEHSDFEIHAGATIRRGEDDYALLDGDLDEAKFVSALKKFGYDPSTMDPTESRGLPRLGTLAYDLHTGRRIVHKGNNRWVGVKDRSFVVQYEMPAQAVAYDEALEADATLAAGNTVDPFGDLSLVSLRPKIKYHRSGAVSILNPALLNRKSRFLREHRSVFLGNFTHHNLSEYSGLLSSTYFDLTLHARAAQLHGDSSLADTASGGDDDITEFNYIQSPSPSQNIKKGFTQSFLTDSALLLADSKSRAFPALDYPGSSGQIHGGPSLNAASVLTVPGSNVRYAASGHPIRGARKPHANGATLLNGVAERPSEQNWRYSQLATSYKSKSSTDFASRKTVAGLEGSRKSALSSTARSAVSSVVPSEKWKASNWGKLKSGVERLATVAASDGGIQSAIYRAATDASLASSSVGMGFDGENLDFTSTQRDRTSAEGSDADSDEEMWRSRSVYKVSKDAAVKVGVWPRKPKQNYKLRYTWVPQPLLHNAVNNLYYEKTVWDFRRESAETNEYDYKKEIREGKPKRRAKQEKTSMLAIVGEGRSAASPGRIRDGRSRGSMYSGDDLSPMRSVGASGKSGFGSPSDSSVASSKYYRNFVGDSERTGNAGALASQRKGGSNVGLTNGVMITALADDNSSIGSASDGEGEFGAQSSAAQSASGSPARAEQRTLLKKASGVSYALRGGEDGRSTHYEIHSSAASSVGSASPDTGAKYGAAFSPSPQRHASKANKESVYQFPSPIGSFTDLKGLVVGGDVGNRSGWSSPGASVSVAGGPSGPGSVAGSADSSGAWDAVSGAPLGAFYNAKTTSKSIHKLGTHQENSDTEFAHGDSGAEQSTGSYLAERPVALQKEGRKGVMFVEKHTTHPASLKVNHYLHQSQRNMAPQVQAGETEEAHIVLRPPPPTDTPTNSGANAPKYKYKQSARSSTFNEAEALSKATQPRVTRAPPPYPPPQSQGGASAGGGVPGVSAKSGLISTLGGSNDGSVAREGSSKRLGKKETIHPYEWA